jgi:hypothetical protein
LQRNVSHKFFFSGLPLVFPAANHKRGRLSDLRLHGTLSCFYYRSVTEIRASYEQDHYDGQDRVLQQAGHVCLTHKPKSAIVNYVNLGRNPDRAIAASLHVLDHMNAQRLRPAALSSGLPVLAALQVEVELAAADAIMASGDIAIDGASDPAFNLVASLKEEREQVLGGLVNEEVAEKKQAPRPPPAAVDPAPVAPLKYLNKAALMIMSVEKKEIQVSAVAIAAASASRIASGGMRSGPDQALGGLQVVEDSEEAADKKQAPPKPISKKRPRSAEVEVANHRVLWTREDRVTLQASVSKLGIGRWVEVVTDAGLFAKGITNKKAKAYWNQYFNPNNQHRSSKYDDEK